MELEHLAGAVTRGRSCPTLSLCFPKCAGRRERSVIFQAIGVPVESEGEGQGRVRGIADTPSCPPGVPSQPKPKRAAGLKLPGAASVSLMTLNKLLPSLSLSFPCYTGRMWVVQSFWRTTKQDLSVTLKS